MGRLNSTRRAALGGILASGVVGSLAEARGRLRMGRPTVASLQPTTEQTSVTHRSATYTFSVPVPVGTYADGQPFVVSDRAFMITSITPDGSSVASGTYTDSVTHAPVVGASFVKNGAMVNPWFFGASLGSLPQGFDGLLGVAEDTGGMGSGIMAYSGALNVDPAIAGAYNVPIGHSASIVKSVRRTGLTTPPAANWRHFEDWCVLHVVAARPLAGAFSPAISDTDKTSYITTAMVNKACLGAGFTPSTGMPTQATVLAGDYFHPIQPFYGQSAEQRRRMIIDRVTEPSTETVYSREFGRVWSNALAALLSQGQSADNGLFYSMLSFGINLLGGLHRGYAETNGAGQSAGHKQFAQLLGHACHASVAGLMDECLQIQGNCTHQQFYTPASHVGVQAYWPGNHSVHFWTAQPAHVGRPHWVTTLPGGTRPPASGPRYDYTIDADYEFTAGVASFVEMLNICLLKAGPNGWDGSQVIAQHASSLAGEGAASIAYMDRYRTFVDGVDIWGFSNSESVLETRHRAYYDDRRAGVALPAWTGVPDDITPSKQTAITAMLAPATGGFTWNFSSVRLATQTVLEWQVQYSLDYKSWVDVTTQGSSGTQTGLPAGIKYYVRVRRRSAAGWSVWSHNWPRATTSIERNTITTTGTPSGTVTNTVAPKLLQRTYPAFAGPLYSDAAATLDLSATTTLYVGVGAWTGALPNASGAPSFSYQWKRGGVAIAFATASSYDLVPADLGTNIACDVTLGGVTAATGTVAIPSLPALPTNTIIDTSFDAAFSLYYDGVYQSLENNTSGCLVATTLTSVVGTFIATETVTSSGNGSGVCASFTGGNKVSISGSGQTRFRVGETLTGLTSGATATIATTTIPVELLPTYVALSADGETVITRGVLRGNKNGSSPTLLGNIAATKPLTIGQTYRFTAKIPVGVNKATVANTNLKVGNVSGGSQYLASTLVAPATAITAPVEITVTFDFVAATNTALWVSLQIPTGTGGTVGGDVQFSELSVIKIS